jgi:hypothetical protein
VTAHTTRALAAQAQEIAGTAAPGSAARKAYGAASVALATTNTLTHARRVLAEWGGPDDIKAAALAAISELNREAA